jgi:hypothetical protein
LVAFVINYSAFSSRDRFRSLSSYLPPFPRHVNLIKCADFEFIKVGPMYER